jgi:transcriptional regulator with XRE-family HTH domain
MTVDRKPNPVDVHVGARLRLRRNIIGINQKRLAEATGVAWQQIQKYEHGIDRVSASCLYRCARRLNVPVSYFFDGLPDGEARRKPSDRDSSLSGAAESRDEVLRRRETLQLVRAYYGIADRKRRRVVYQFIRAMTETPPS